MKRIPAWALYVFSFLLLHIGSHISLLSKHDLAVSDFYLPTAFSIILIYWFGPRVVVPVVFINAVITSPLWGNPAEAWPLWFLYAIPETLFGFLSWLFLLKLSGGKYWFPDLRNTILFLVVGILIPAIIESVLLQTMLVTFGDLSTDKLGPYIFSNVVSEFATTFFITLPVLFYLTPRLQQEGIVNPQRKRIPVPDLPDRRQIGTMMIIFAFLFAVIFFLKFSTYWYFYGFFSLYLAIRFGFGPAIISNLYILFIAYIIPKFASDFGADKTIDFSNAVEILLGANSLFVFVAITGRVISDLKIAERKLLKQNIELEQMNQELDRFVYSVSHDLSAPLKTILGIVSISRLSDNAGASGNYFTMVEKSVLKMEAFIIETLDYSRNKRQPVKPEQIEIQSLCQEILDYILSPVEGTHISVSYQLDKPLIIADRTRLRIILNNILSNAVRFQKVMSDELPVINISTRESEGFYIIEVMDNGEGIPPERQGDIFKMFYRGNERSTGSGLGLYVAREAATKIDGTITVISSPGKGSTFTVKIRVPKIRPAS